MMRTYKEVSRLSSFEDRFRYLKLIDGKVGEETFGFDRYLNQVFYKSKEWKNLRNYLIVRDNGCDLGVDGYNIYGKIIIHHLNPITKKDVLDRSDTLLDPENLICVTHNTHNAIHYGDENLLMTTPIERTFNDTKLW